MFLVVQNKKGCVRRVNEREVGDKSRVMPGEALAGQCKVIYFSVCEMGH